MTALVILDDVPWARTGQWLVAVAAALAAVAYLWTKWIGPFLARPIGRTIGAAIRAELRELVEEIVTQLIATLLRDQGLLQVRQNALEEKLRAVERRIVDHHRQPHPPPRLGP